MTGKKIGFLGRVFGRGDTDSESASHPESDAADSDQTGPELASPFFIRYVPGGSVKMLSRSPDFSDIRTLDGEVIKPQTYLEVPIAPDVDALEIQVLLDELQGPDRDILEALETKSRYEEWSGRTPEEVKSMLSEALDDLVSRGLCRVLESVITTPSGDLLRVDAKEESDTTQMALLAACHQVNEQKIRQLLERGANPDATDGKGWSTFHYLASNNADPVLFEILAEAGANPNAQSRLDANTALMIAVNNASGDSVRGLLNAGASAAIARNDRLTALHMAVSKGEIEIARMLLEADADVDQRGYGHGGTALHIAAGQGNLPMIDLLLQHGGDPAIIDEKGYSAVDIANGTGHFEAAERLLARSEEPEEEAIAAVTAPASALGRWDVASDAEPDPELESRVPLIREKAPTVAKALDNLDRKLEDNPEDVEALKSRGILLQQMGLQKQALRSFDRIVAIDGGDADVFTYCGQIVLGSAVNSQSHSDRAGLLDIAKGSFNMALSKDANHVEAAIGMGTLFFVDSDLPQAMPFFDLALKNDSSSGKAWHMKGLALQSAGQAAEAQAHLAKAAELGFEAS